MDAQGGEKIETMTALFGALLDDARKRNLLSDEFYYLSDSVLGTFKLFQGFHPLAAFPGYRLEQALTIWNQSPVQTRNAVLVANGFLPSQESWGPGVILQFDD